MRDVAVDPVSGRVVVGRVAGESGDVELVVEVWVVVAAERVDGVGVVGVLPVTHGFADVPLSGWRNDAVYWMRSSGVTTGCSATEFCPDQEMTREQQITFLWRYAGRRRRVGRLRLGCACRQVFHEPCLVGVQQRDY